MSDCIFCHERPEKTRGVCQRCYQYFQRETQLGFTTDHDLVRSGFLLPAHGEAALARQAEGRRQAIARKQSEREARRATV